MPTADTLQKISDYASSLSGEDRQNFISKFNSIKDDDAKIEKLAGRISGISKPAPKFSSIAEANAAMSQARKEQAAAEYGASPLGFADVQLGRFINPLTQNILGAAESITGGLSGQIPAYQQMADRQGAAFNIGMAAGVIPVGMAISKALASQLPKVGPFMQNVLSGAVTGAYTMPENRAVGAAIGGATAPATTLIGQAVKFAKRPLDDRIFETYSKAINPNISKIKNSVKLEEFKNKTTMAMKTIAKNSDNISFENAETGLIENRLPKSRIETFEALKQTKQNIYSKYNELQKQATGKGAKIDVGSIAEKSFKEIEESRQFKLYKPELQKEAKQLSNRIKGNATPEEVQKDLEFLNNEMRGYYQKGDYAAANIYAKYASNLRSSLDSAIEETLKKSGYKDLKNQYSSLKYVEEDLAKAAARQLKKTDPKLSESVSDPLAMIEMAHGVFTSNPANFAAGATLKSVMTLRKFLNNPDVQIERLFKTIQKTNK